jgi:hypothetical protein
VSPNVNYDERSVSAWAQASIFGTAAFMGWGPNHVPLGDKFAHEIGPQDVILIGRRHKSKPEVVGFGVVQGKFKTTIPKRIKIPDGGDIGSFRNLSPFIDLTTTGLPAGMPFVKALRHSSALAELHPDRNNAHKKICEWMDRQLKESGKTPSNKSSQIKPDGDLLSGSNEVQIADPPTNHQLDYAYRTKKQIVKARKIEAHLVEDYRRWLAWQGRRLSALKCTKLQCDAFETSRRNLIEAKSSSRRELIRMAVGQLLDYAYQVRKRFPKTHLAILVPEKPRPELVDWLRPLEISLIWREKGTFSDDTRDHQFA